MGRIGSLLLNIAVALYLFANGILGFDKKGEFEKITGEIFKGEFANVVCLVLSIIAFIAGILLILQLFKIAIPRIDLLMLIIIIVWAVFIVIVDIINPIGKGFGNFFDYLAKLAPHLMILGALITARQPD